MTDTIPVPRTHTGQRVRHLTSGYLVLVDWQGRDASRRVTGEVYIALERPNRMSVVFVPDEGVVTVDLKPERDGRGFELRDQDDEFVMFSELRFRKSDDVRIDFGTPLNDLVR